jgi:hypothetical protein
LGGAVNVGIQDAGLETDGLQPERKVNGRGRLADAALAGSHGYHVLDAGHLLHLPPFAGSRRRCRRGGRPSTTPGTCLLYPGAFPNLAGPPAAVCAAPARLVGRKHGDNARDTLHVAHDLLGRLAHDVQLGCPFRGHCDCKRDTPVLQQYFGHQTQIDNVVLEVGALDLAQPLEDLFFGKVHLNALRRFAGLRRLPSVGGLSDKPLSRLLL